MKRTRKTPRVRVAPCDMRDNVIGEWQAASAHIVGGEEEQAANRLLDRKCFLKRIFNVLTKLNRHTRTMLKIELV